MSGKKKKKEISYWQSYSDMMAALLLLFVLIMSFVLYKSAVIYNEKEIELSVKQNEVVIQKQKLSEQESVLKLQKNQLAEQQTMLDELIGIRARLILKLSEQLKLAGLQVYIDPLTGAIAFDANILFDFNKSKLKKEGRAFLADFLPIYFKTLFNPEFKPFVAEIIIEGHTDTQGEYMYNLELSQQRAFEVASFCLDEKNDIVNEADMPELRKIMTANGRSMSSPKRNANGEIDMDASRRVEMKFRLKDEEMVQKMKQIIEGERP